MISYEISTYSPNGEQEIIIVRSDGVCIPQDPDNTDYQQYLEWVAEGNTATTYSPVMQEVYSAPTDSEIMLAMEVI